MAKDSYIECLLRELKAKKIKKSAADSLIRMYEARKNAYTKAGNAEGAAKAAQETVDAYRNFKMKEQINILRTENHVLKMRKRMAESGKSAPDFLKDEMQKAFLREKSIQENVFNVMDPDVLELFDIGVLGLNRKGNAEILEGMRYAFDPENAKNISPMGQKVGQNIRRVFDTTHAWAKAAGSIRGYIPNYLPQTHVRDLYLRAGDTPDAIVKNVSDFYLGQDLLNWREMHNNKTGMNFTSLEEFRPELENVIRGIVDAPLEKGRSFGVAASMDKRHLDTRWFKFKDYDSFLTHAKRFGAGEEGLIPAFINNVTQEAREIAIMEVFGPRNNVGFNELFQDVKKFHVAESVRQGKEVGKYTENQIEGLYTYLTKSYNASDNDNKWNTALNSVQNYIRGLMLGQASISALSDLAFGKIALRQHGIPALDGLKFYMGSLTGSKYSKQLAKEFGLSARTYMDHAGLETRYAGEGSTKGVTGSFARGVNIASGLNRMTTSGDNGVRIAFGNRLSWILNEKIAFGDTSDALVAKTFRALKDFGMTEKHWDFLLEKAKHVGIGEDSFIIPHVIRDADYSDIADKKLAKEVYDILTDLSNNLSRLTVNEGDLRTRALLSGATGRGRGGPGSSEKMLASSIGVFKSFGISVINTHAIPTYKRIKNPATRAEGMADLADLTILGAFLGAGVIQAKNIVAGRDFQDWDDWRLYKAGMLQAGGFGIAGDILFGGPTSRFDRNIFEELSGPVGGLATDVINLVGEPFKDDPKMAKKSFHFFKRYGLRAPIGHFWYTRLLWDRLVVDRIEEAWVGREEARKDRERIAERNFKEKGQRWLWAPGT